MLALSRANCSSSEVAGGAPGCRRRLGEGGCTGSCWPSGGSNVEAPGSAAASAAGPLEGATWATLDTPGMGKSRNAGVCPDAATAAIAGVGAAAARGLARKAAAACCCPSRAGSGACVAARLRMTARCSLRPRATCSGSSECRKVWIEERHAEEASPPLPVLWKAALRRQSCPPLLRCLHGEGAQ